MASEHLDEVKAFKESYKKETETLVTTTFPKKIVHLNSLIDSEQFNFSSLPSIKQDLNVPLPDPVASSAATDQPQAKKRKLESLANNLDVPGSKVYSLPDGEVKTNQNISKLVDIVKPLIRDLIEHTNKVKMWIAFLIPRIEDGNNFGVSVQEDTMAEARQVESEAATYLDQITRYFITRGKIVSKVAKYPHIEDYRRTVFELDEKQFMSLRLVLIELRNHYSSLHDVIQKNMDKIKKPRSSNTDNMY